MPSRHGFGLASQSELGERSRLIELVEECWPPNYALPGSRTRFLRAERKCHWPAVPLAHSRITIVLTTLAARFGSNYRSKEKISSDKSCLEIDR
jgi:hypothetical protein